MTDSDCGNLQYRTFTWLQHPTAVLTLFISIIQFICYTKSSIIRIYANSRFSCSTRFVSIYHTTLLQMIALQWVTPHRLQIVIQLIDFHSKLISKYKTIGVILAIDVHNRSQSCPTTIQWKAFEIYYSVFLENMLIYFLGVNVRHACLYVYHTMWRELAFIYIVSNNILLGQYTHYFV